MHIDEIGNRLLSISTFSAVYTKHLAACKYHMIYVTRSSLYDWNSLCPYSSITAVTLLQIKVKGCVPNGIDTLTFDWHLEYCIAGNLVVADFRINGLKAFRRNSYFIFVCACPMLQWLRFWLRQWWVGTTSTREVVWRLAMLLECYRSIAASTH